MIRLITEVIKDIFPFLIIVLYSTIAVGAIFQLMNLDQINFSNYMTLSYLITLKTILDTNYNTIQWICFILANIINPMILMNLIISIMGDSFDKVQENRDIADYKEKAALIVEIEVSRIWKRSSKLQQRFHLCKEIESSSSAGNWLGKVRELKLMIIDFKHGQNILGEGIHKIIADSQIKTEKELKNERILIGLKEKLIDSSDSEQYAIYCTLKHKLVHQYFIEKALNCNKCKALCEYGYYCGICSYVLCKKCHRKEYIDKNSNSNITCYRGHKLLWLSDSDLYEKSMKKISNCSGCKKILASDYFNCRDCKWNLCFKCFDIVNRKMGIAWTMQCESNHSMKWENIANVISYKCRTCLEIFHKTESFHCRLCNYDICIRCFNHILKD